MSNYSIPQPYDEDLSKIAALSGDGYLTRLPSGEWALVLGTVRVSEVDGTPANVAVSQLVFPNGTVSVNSGVATITGLEGPQGIQGIQGVQGVPGVQGNPGPNQVTNATSTNLTGVLFGNGTTVKVATAAEVQASADLPSALAAYATTAAVAAGYQPLDSDLTAIAALATTPFGRALLTMADAVATRTTIGLGTSDSPTFANITSSGNVDLSTNAASLTCARTSMSRVVLQNGDVSGYTDSTRRTVLLGDNGGGLSLAADRRLCFSSSTTEAFSPIVASIGLVSSGVVGVYTTKTGSTLGSLNLANLTASGPVTTSEVQVTPVNNSWLFASTEALLRRGNTGIGTASGGFGATTLFFSANGQNSAAIVPNFGMTLNNTYYLGWSSSPSASGPNVNINRLSDGVLQVGTTTNNALGSLNLASLTASGPVTAGGTITASGSAGSGGAIGLDARNTSASGEGYLAIRNDRYAAAFELFGSSFPNATVRDLAIFTAQSGIVSLGFSTLGSAPIDFYPNSGGTFDATTRAMRIESTRVVSLSNGLNLASRTKTAVLASSPATNAGRFQLSDSGLVGREVYPDGTNWRYASDDSIVT